MTQDYIFLSLIFIFFLFFTPQTVILKKSCEFKNR